ncbi:hypothetical protein MOQ_006193 [Trypanosoma cruzi marinkellei]|uniref:BRCT domain-containing protein n=1 Tax=Trypanosoma cruzi marinkellei TaxID=85056 RepID=K2MWA8_TRYCR|nr:hypothetical protein MOQ_006193 [Trypanosoma cruzi marinkellei]
MLRGHVFVAAPDVPQDVRLLVAACGGRVVSSVEASVTLGLVVCGGEARLDCAAQLRGLRIPILRSSWVRASVAAGRMLPMKHPHTEYDPALFESLRFTTTMLPGRLKRSLVAAIQFFGGTYSPELTSATDILLHGEEGRMEGIAGSLKWRCAWEWAIPCVHFTWLQECIASGRLGALPPAAAAAETTRNGEEEESSCSSLREAAGGNCASYPLFIEHQKRPRIDVINVVSDAGDQPLQCS